MQIEQEITEEELKALGWELVELEGFYEIWREINGTGRISYDPKKEEIFDRWE